MFPKPTVYNQADAMQRELSQQMKQVLIAASAIDALTQKLSTLESQLSSFETKFSNVSKVLKLQQDLSERRDCSLLELQSRLTSLEKSEKVVADLAYRIHTLESGIRAQSPDIAARTRIDDRVAALEERVSRLTLKQADTSEKHTERMAASLSAAKENREDLMLAKMQSAVEGLQKQIDTMRAGKVSNSPPKKVADRLRSIENELQSKASVGEVKKLSDILEREIRSREASLLDSWPKDDPQSTSKSLEARLNQLENQITTCERVPSLTEVSKHLGTGCGSFGVDPGLTVPHKAKKRPESAKTRPKSQGARRGRKALLK